MLNFRTFNLPLAFSPTSPQKNFIYIWKFFCSALFGNWSGFFFQIGLVLSSFTKCSFCVFFSIHLSPNLRSPFYLGLLLKQLWLILWAQSLLVPFFNNHFVQCSHPKLQLLWQHICEKKYTHSVLWTHGDQLFDMTWFAHVGNPLWDCD